MLRPKAPPLVRLSYRVSESPRRSRKVSPMERSGTLSGMSREPPSLVKMETSRWRDIATPIFAPYAMFVLAMTSL